MFLVKFNAWPYCATTDTVIIALRHVSSMNVELQHTPPLSAQSIREERRRYVVCEQKCMIYNVSFHVALR